MHPREMNIGITCQNAENLAPRKMTSESDISFGIFPTIMAAFIHYATVQYFSRNLQKVSMAGRKENDGVVYENWIFLFVKHAMEILVP
jgi:hypothetical protein